MHSLLCNCRGQWCSKSCIPVFPTSTHRGEQSQEGWFNGNDLREDSYTSLSTCCPYQLLLGLSFPSPPCPAGMTALLDVQNSTLQGHLPLWSMHTTGSKKRLPDREQMHRSYGQLLPAALKHNSAPIPLLCHACAWMDSAATALAHFRSYLGYLLQTQPPKGALSWSGSVQAGGDSTT